MAEPLPTVAVDLRALVPEATGIGVYTRSLLLALARRRPGRYRGLAHRPVRRREELEATGVALDDAPSRLPLGVLWQQLALPRRLGEADLLWSPLLTLPLTCPVPAVLNVHDLTVLLYPETHRLKVRWSVLPFLARSIEAARCVVTLSHATAGDLRFHFPEAAGKLRVVYPGVGPEYTPGTAEEVAAVRRELGAPEGYLLYVGTLEPRKNVGALVSAWEGLEAAGEGVLPLVVAGDPGWHNRPLLRRLEALAPRGVIHLGRVSAERLVRLYRGARAFVYPSLYEGFGLPPLEAMACGVPPVVSAASSLPEVVGETGVLVEPTSVKGLATAIRDLLAEPERAAELGARARERARGFTWERSAAAMEEVFAEAVASPERVR